MASRSATDLGPDQDVHVIAPQGYSICRAVLMATSWPSSLPTTCRLMSMPGSDPRRADHPPVVHEAAVGMNHRLRGGLAQQVDGPVVRGRLQAVEQPGLRQQQRPGADRQDQFRLRGRLPDPLDQRRVVHLLAGALTTGNQKQIGLRAVGEPVVRVDAEATTGHDRPGFLGHGQDVEGGRFGEAVGDGEDLERPAEVQHFHVVEDQDGEGAGEHGILRG